MAGNNQKSWLALLVNEYWKRFVSPFKLSGLFVFSLILLILVGFLGCWISIYESYQSPDVNQDAINRAFCGSVISLVIVSCVDVVLSLLRSDIKKHQKNIEIQDVTYAMSIGLVGFLIVIIALFGIAFAPTGWGTLFTMLCLVGSILLWIQVNATNPVYFEKGKDLSSMNATPELPKSQSSNPYQT